MINRTIWTQPFSESHNPAWPCPACDHGTLRLLADSLKFKQSRQSRELQEEEYSEIEWITGRYSCLFQCRMSNCREIVTSAGRFHVTEFYAPDGTPELVEGFSPEFLAPALPMFRIPDATPDDVREEIQRAFQLFWTDKAASANRIRSALELLLTHKKVKRFKINKRNKREALSLHARIELFRQQEPDIADSLLAVKWLGNAGSHGTSAVTADDIFDGLDLLQHAFEELYDNRTRQLSAIRKQINKRKGPRTRP